jgi:hypothetical protein
MIPPRYCMVKLLFTFFGFKAWMDCINFGNRSLFIVPVSVTSLLFTEALTPGKSLVMSCKPLVRESSGEIWTGAVVLIDVSGGAVWVVGAVSLFLFLQEVVTRPAVERINNNKASFLILNILYGEELPSILIH